MADEHEAQGGAAGTSETELRTFLIADIRGYTTYTREHGDEAAGRLAAQFAELVRSVVGGRGGFLLELRGDEALVVFVSARNALRAAVELQEQFAEARLAHGVGIGLDAGEAVPVEGGYRGSALNVAARLSSQAKGGEVLASEAVIHLAARVEGVAYVEPRSYRLKGLAEPIRAVAVMAETRVPRGFQRTLRRARAVGIDRRIAIGGAAVGAVAIVALSLSGAFGLTSRPAASSAPSPSPDPLAGLELPGIAFVDAASGAITGTLPIRNPVEMAAVDGKIWALGINPKAMYVIDPTTRVVERTVTLPLAKEGFWWIDGETIWMTDFGTPRVIGIDGRTGIVTRDFDLRDDPADDRKATGVTVGAGSLWVARPEVGEILRLDPLTGAVQARIDTFIPDVLAFGDDALWVAGAGRITRIDPATNRPTFEPQELAFDRFLAFIEFGGGYAWTADEEQGIVWAVDRSGRVVATYETGAGARPLAYADGKMWVGNQDAGTISGIDVVTGGITTHHIGHGHVGIAAVAGQIAVSVWPSAEEAVADIEGSVLHISVTGAPFYSLAPDPPVALSFELRQAEYATCATLFSYPDEPAPGGWELRPEVAEAMPEVSPDGLTQTIRIREGFGFSPPSTETLSAETFRYAIERSLSPRLGRWAAGFRLLDMVEGAREFHEGTANAVTGLAADGNVLSIRLTRRTNDLAARLALPYFCPVPIGTPIVLEGLDPTPPLPSAGPYYLAQHYGGELAVLRQNPNYAGTRPRSFDHIVFRFGVDPPAAVAQVDAGEIDAAITPPWRSLLSPHGELARRWGPGSEGAAAGNQRWFGAARFGVSFVALDPRHELFRDADVRRAVGLALDRRALSLTADTAPAGSLLPPSIPGSPPADATIPEPDIDAARTFMAGRTGTAVMIVPKACDDCVEWSESLAGQLGVIGIEVDVRALEDREYEAARFEPDGGDIDILDGFLDTDGPEPAAFMSTVRQVPWLPQAILDDLDAMDALTDPTERRDAAVALADRLTDDGLAFATDYPVYPMYIGEKVGCAFVQPAIGAVDLAALCPK